MRIGFVFLIEKIKKVDKIDVGISINSIYR